MDNHADVAYSAPVVRSLGSVEEMTRQQFDKIGSAVDAYTALSGGALDGTIQPDP
jgi:hypothetical protein